MKPLFNKRVCRVAGEAFLLRLAEIDDELRDSYDLIELSADDLSKLRKLYKDRFILEQLLKFFETLARFDS